MTLRNLHALHRFSHRDSHCDAEGGSRIELSTCRMDLDHRWASFGRLMSDAGHLHEGPFFLLPRRCILMADELQDHISCHSLTILCDAEDSPKV
jgi:hypothetical protein